VSTEKRIFYDEQNQVGESTSDRAKSAQLCADLEHLERKRWKLLERIFFYGERKKVQHQQKPANINA
jgi:hypothetical protein